MTSTCISSCVKDTRAPVRATYTNMYKWPESDAAFLRSVSANGRRSGSGHPTVVDSISCRQFYLRSYTFSREESVPEKPTKCLGRARERKVVQRRKSKSKSDGGNNRRKCGAIKRAKEVSRATLSLIFRRLLSCTAKVDVVG